MEQYIQLGLNTLAYRNMLVIDPKIMLAKAIKIVSSKEIPKIGCRHFANSKIIICQYEPKPLPVHVDLLYEGTKIVNCSLVFTKTGFNIHFFLPFNGPFESWLIHEKEIKAYQLELYEELMRI